MKKFWKILAGVESTFWLLMLIMSNLIVGSFYMKYSPKALFTLNHLPFPEWMRTFGASNLGDSWWLWTLGLLMALLAVNTAACVIDRLLTLLPQYGKTSLPAFSLKLTPTVVHIFFFIAVGGHMLSTLTATYSSMPIEQGAIMDLDQTHRCRVDTIERDFYTSPAAINGFLKQARVTLTLECAGNQESRSAQFLKPLFWGGYTLHLDSAGKDRNSGNLLLVARRDIGVRLIIPCFIINVLLLLFYYTMSNGGFRSNSES